jgi:hypothetical protein
LNYKLGVIFSLETCSSLGILKDRITERKSSWRWGGGYRGKSSGGCSTGGYILKWRERQQAELPCRNKPVVIFLVFHICLSGNV